MADLEAIVTEQNELLGKLKPIAEELAGKATLTADRLESLSTASDELTNRIQTLEEQRAAEERSAKADQKLEEIEALLKGHRAPSKLDKIGPAKADSDGDIGFYTAVWMAGSRDHETQEMGKARLAELGSTHGFGEGKATIGDTAANGGYLVPAIEARPIIETATAEGAARQLFTVIDGINGSPVPINYEGTAPTRAVIWTPGTLKENVNFTVGQYSATMYVLARIFDVGNQLLRRSRGAAERSVRSKLARAFALGEDYYAFRGNGTTEPNGLLTSLTASGAYTSSFTPSNSTLAGSIASAIAVAGGALANRSRYIDGVVINSGDFWKMISQGTDDAGFFFAPSTGPSGINAGRGELMAPFGAFGVRIAHSPSMTADKLVGGEFKSAELYFGEGYRVDTSDQAGTRWDYNLTGFRGEEEMGFNADPYVASGLFQQITDLTA